MWLVVCGERQYYLGKEDVILNPLLVVEVLSPSTEGYDRSDKFSHYQSIEALQEYLLVEQDEARVILYTRHEDHWDFREIRGLGSSVYLSSIEEAIAMADIYAKIKFDAEKP